MPRLLAAALLLLGLTPAMAEARTVTDNAGRTVEVPDEIRTVFAAGPPAAIFLYVLAPETTVGWSRALREGERP